MTASEMRQAILDGISGITLGSFSVSQELPWDAAGTPLYQKNPKVFYVDQPDSEQTNIVNVLCGGVGIANKTTTISAFLVVDAKQLPTNYDSVTNQVVGVKDTAAITGVRSRECDVQTSFIADAMLTEFVFRFTELTT